MPIILLMFVCLNYPASASENGSKISFSEVPKRVIQSIKSLNFPAPKFKELGMVAFSQDKPTNVTYGHYRIDGISSGLASISTAATQRFKTKDVAYNLFLLGFLDKGKTLDHKLRSNGYGVSAGGLIELFSHNSINMATTNNLRFLPTNFSQTMTSESKITKLEIISGQLFPLKTGNKMVIQQTSRNSMEKSKSRTTRLEFEVTKHMTGYLLSNTALPGDVFEITRHFEHGKKGNTSTFIFSSYLGWIVESHIGNITEQAVGWDYKF